MNNPASGDRRVPSGRTKDETVSFPNLSGNERRQKFLYTSTIAIQEEEEKQGTAASARRACPRVERDGVVYLGMDDRFMQGGRRASLDSSLPDPPVT